MLVNVKPPAGDLFEVIHLLAGGAPVSLAIALPGPSLVRIPG